MNFRFFCQILKARKSTAIIQALCRRIPTRRGFWEFFKRRFIRGDTIAAHPALYFMCCSGGSVEHMWMVDAEAFTGVYTFTATDSLFPRKKVGSGNHGTWNEKSQFTVQVFRLCLVHVKKWLWIEAESARAFDCIFFCEPPPHIAIPRLLAQILD